MVVIQKNKKIILFDGVCNLCNNTVKFIIKRDRNDVFRFAPLQSDIGKKLTQERGIDTENIDSIIVIDPGIAYYIKSDAFFEVVNTIKGGWQVLTIFKHILPTPVRDWFYDRIAKSRYSWFGKKDTCMIPTPELQEKFL